MPFDGVHCESGSGSERDSLTIYCCSHWCLFVPNRKHAFWWCAFRASYMLTCYMGLTGTLHQFLAWFNVCIQVFRCLHNTAPGYLSTLCQPISSVLCRLSPPAISWLQSLELPHVRLATYGRRAFANAGPPNWNSLPVHLRDKSFSLNFQTPPQDLSCLIVRHATHLGLCYKKMHYIKSTVISIISVCYSWHHL